MGRFLNLLWLTFFPIYLSASSMGSLTDLLKSDFSNTDKDKTPNIRIIHDLSDSNTLRNLENIFSFPRRSFISSSYSNFGFKPRSYSNFRKEKRNLSLNFNVQLSDYSNNFLVICFGPYEFISQSSNNHSDFLNRALQGFVLEDNTLYVRTGMKPYGNRTLFNRRGVFQEALEWLREKGFFQRNHLSLLTVGFGEGGLRAREFQAYLQGDHFFPGTAMQPSNLVESGRTTALITLDTPHQGYKAFQRFDEANRVGKNKRFAALCLTLLSKIRFLDQSIPFIAMRPSVYRWVNYWQTNTSLSLVVSLVQEGNDYLQTEEASPWYEEETGALERKLADQNVQVVYPRSINNINQYVPENRVCLEVLRKTIAFVIRTEEGESYEGL